MTTVSQEAREADELLEALSDEADLCRNDGANDIANLLDEARNWIARHRQQADREAAASVAVLPEMRVAVARAIYEAECSGPFDEAPRIDRNLAMDAADAAIRAMDRTEVMAYLREVVPLLDGAQDALGQAALDEARNERGKPLRQVTAMQRYQAAQKLVDRGWKLIGAE